MTAQLFFHGLPGGPDDRRLLSADWQGPALQAGDTLDPKLPGGDAALDLIGFSLGAMAALNLAARTPDRIRQLTLISPAAPLQLGDFLPRMAGRPVFALAQRSALGLRVLTGVQGGVARLSPNFLIRQLFAASCPQDRALTADPANRDVLRAGLRHSLIAHPARYSAMIRAYVADWTAILPRVSCPVTIWQGTRDTWTPPDMAEALARALPGPVDLRMIDGAGHYAALAQARP